MSQIVIYNGVVVEPVERVGSKVKVRTQNQVDAQKAGLEFRDFKDGKAIFEALVDEAKLVPVD